jgi:ribonuclease D
MTQAAMTYQANIQVFEGDLPAAYAESARTAGVVCCDLEMSGLDWRQDRIATCQLHAPGAGVAIVRITDARPARLVALLEEPAVLKVFHFAVGDLRFILHHWEAAVVNVACTKIASKLLAPEETDHSLAGLVGRHLDVHLPKHQQLSDWFAPQLTDDQLTYAANDVLYLLPLLRRLEDGLAEKGLLALARRAYDHIPTRAALDVRDYPDIYTY